MEKIVIKNLEIKPNTFTTIIGKNGSGKSTLAKMIYNSLDDRKTIYIKEISKNIFDVDTTKEYIYYYLKNLNLKNHQIDEKIEYLKKELDINHLLDYSYETLSIGEKQIVNLGCAIVSESDTIIIDNAMSMLNDYIKEKIFKSFKKLKDATIINVTNNPEEIIYGEYVIIIDNMKVILNKEIKEIVEDEKQFRENNMDLPFMISLSLKLKYYNLLDKPILDMNKMIGALWK